MNKAGSATHSKVCDSSHQLVFANVNKLICCNR